MKHLLTFVVLLVLFASCNDKTKEDYIKEAFINYVKTDFDDPNDFCEITDIEVVDTLNKYDLFEIFNSLVRIGDLLSDKERVELKNYLEAFSEDTTNIIIYLVKVRVEHFGSKTIENYYVINNGREMKVQDHNLKGDEVPKLYEDFFNFAEDVIKSRIY